MHKITYLDLNDWNNTSLGVMFAEEEGTEEDWLVNELKWE